MAKTRGFLVLLLLLIGVSQCWGEKYVYATADECDRYSAAALYHDKFKPITHNMLEDSTEFVNRVCDAMSESLTAIMAQLPDKEVSDREESKVFSQFTGLKKNFASRTRKCVRNVTSAWDTLLSCHLHLMLDDGQASLGEYLNRTQELADAYKAARSSLDLSLSSFVGFVKGTVRDGLQGIQMAAEEAIEKNHTAHEKDDSKKEGDTPKQEMTKEDRLEAKKAEIAEMVAQGFLGKITLEVIRKKVDLFRKIDTRPEDRDNVMDDLLFDILMIRNRVVSIIQPDPPKDQGAVDLARRGVFLHWNDLAEKMYQDKMAAIKTREPGPRPDLYYKRMWADEEQLGETLLNLMEVYP